jgi:hypothetical protein
MRNQIDSVILVTLIILGLFAASALAYTQATPGNPNIVIPEAGDPEYGRYDYVVYPTGDPDATHPHRFFPSILVTDDAHHIDWVVGQGGGGRILLKAHRAGEPAVFQHFEMGLLSIPGGVVLVNITNDTVIEGEELSGRLTEINNGVACLGAGLYGASPSRVVLRNLTARRPAAFFFGTWGSIFEVEIDNLNVLDARPSAGFLNLGVLIHHAGSFLIRSSTFTVSSSDPGMFTAGVTYVPFTGPDEYSSAVITNNHFDMGTVWTGTIGILATEIGMNSSGGPHPGGAELVVRNNTVAYADIGAHVGGFGHYTVADNLISAGKIGLMLFTYDDEDGIVAENNSIHLDPAGSADVLHDGAGVFGFSYSIAEIVGLTAIPGSLKSSKVSNNELTGSADYGVYLADTSLGQNDSRFNVFSGNLFTTLTAVKSQVMIGPGSHDNFFGPDDETGSGGNSFGCANDGWELCGGGPGLLCFTVTSHDNKVVSTKLNGSPYGIDICYQVRDQSGLNEVPGSERCHKMASPGSESDTETPEWFERPMVELRVATPKAPLFRAVGDDGWWTENLMSSAAAAAYLLERSSQQETAWNENR